MHHNKQLHKYKAFGYEFTDGKISYIYVVMYKSFISSSLERKCIIGFRGQVNKHFCGSLGRANNP